MGTQLPPQKGHSPQFSANVRCGQTAGWTKMPLGVQANLGPGVFVLDGDPAPSKKNAQPQIFGPCLLWPNGCPTQLLLSSCKYMNYSAILKVLGLPSLEGRKLS